jgi:hypothetical protein
MRTGCGWGFSFRALAGNKIKSIPSQVMQMPHLTKL